MFSGSALDTNTAVDLHTSTPAGDLYVYIAVKDHPELRRDGTTIHSDVEISYVDAILGTQVGLGIGWAWRVGRRRGCGWAIQAWCRLCRHVGQHMTNSI